MSEFYWSSSSNANNNDNAWGVNFNNGNDNNNNKSSSYYVRAVRFGKCSLLSFESIYKAYLDCRKRKRGTINALNFEYDLLGNLTNLALEIQKGEYRPSRSVCFITNTPKLREIFAADFRDRIVHHLVVRELEKLYEPCFIHDSYACRLNKGTHAAIKRLRHFMLKVSKNKKCSAFFMQLDVRSFFMSIDKNILFYMLEKKVKSDALLYLLFIIVFHDCTQDYLFKGDAKLIDKIPPHKSLFKVGHNKGLPIGNLTSQFFANVYLNELDQFIKHGLRCRFYLRYVDDFILLHSSRKQLLNWKSEIEKFLAEKLALVLKKEYFIKRLSEGSDFLGYIVRPDYILSRNRVVSNLKYKLKLFRKKIILNISLASLFPTFPCKVDKSVIKISLDPELIVQIRQTLSSYLGHFKHANCYALIHSLFDKHPWLKDIFEFYDGRISERLQHKGIFKSLKFQAAFFRSRFENHICLFQIGKYIEAVDDDALYLNSVLGLKVKKNFRKMKYVVGFQLRFKKYFIQRLLYAGCNLVIIEECGMGKYLKERRIAEIYRLKSA
ncbi:RNA-directed DNA polymerase [Candidatus Magnetomoraceae bacterium gMMP-15]